MTSPFRHFLRFVTIILTLSFHPHGLSAADEPTANKHPIYDESADGQAQIATAVTIAQEQHKRVLLQFGANWCIWCRQLHMLFSTDSTLSGFLKSNYVVTTIDLNKDHNKSLVSLYKAKRSLPFLVVLDSDGKHLTTKQTDDLEEGDHHSPQKVMSFLKEWAPKN